MRHTDLRLLALCLKAAGTSFRISGLWPRAIWNSPCPIEVAKSLASYTTQLGFRNATAWSRDVSEPKLGRVQKAVSFFFGVALSSHCVVCFFCPPCRQRESAFIIGELFFVTGCPQAFRPPVTKDVFGQGKFTSLCAALILQQFVYHNRKCVGVGLSEV